jgi:hypothetical protein
VRKESRRVAAMGASRVAGHPVRVRARGRPVEWRRREQRRRIRNLAGRGQGGKRDGWTLRAKSEELRAES